MEIVSRLLGMSSYKSTDSVKMDMSSCTSKSRSNRSMRTQTYVKFMRRYNPGAPGSSLYEKTFGFATSPLKSASRINKQKRRSMEITRCSTLEQREQYRRLIEQYRLSNLHESPKFSPGKPASQKTKYDANKSVIDLTGRISPESFAGKEPVKRFILQDLEKDNDSSPPETAEKSSMDKIIPAKALKPGIPKDFVSPYLSENLIPNILKTYDTRARERQRQLAEEEKRASLFREKREAKEAMLAEILHQKLQLKEKKVSKVPKLPEITAEMAVAINDAFEPYPPQQVLSEDFNISITREHMSTLFGLNWLNDEVVNFYMELIVQRSKGNTDVPSVHAMNTFFYPKLYKQGYNSVRRWTKKVDIFAKDLVLYPIHLGVHWCLAVIDFMKKEIRYYDSMGGENIECLETLRDYLNGEHKNKKGSEYDLSGWKLQSMKNIPQQMNGSDCGVFTCKFAEYNSLDAELTFSQKDMPYFRRAMVWEILNRKLLR